MTIRTKTVIFFALQVLGWGVFFIALLVFTPVVVHGQTVINPTTYEFIPSADHDAQIDGQAIVVRYELRYLQVGGISVGVVDLGKPVPVAGKITGALSLTFLPFSPSNRYIVYVAAIGSTGEGVSTASNPFAKVGTPAAPGAPILKK